MLRLVVYSAQLYCAQQCCVWRPFCATMLRDQMLLIFIFSRNNVASSTSSSSRNNVASLVRFTQQYFVIFFNIILPCGLYICTGGPI
jgi:hypothetical protein